MNKLCVDKNGGCFHCKLGFKQTRLICKEKRWDILKGYVALSNNDYVYSNDSLYKLIKPRYRKVFETAKRCDEYEEME